MAKSVTPERSARGKTPAPKSDRVTTTVRLNLATVTALKHLAADRGCRMNDLIEQAVAAFLRRP